jgi:hypothetical protein
MNNNEKPYTIGHGGNAGDLIWSLPSIYSLMDKRGLKKCVLVLKPDIPAAYPSNMKHPCGKVQMSRPFCDSLLPLLKMQPRFEDVTIWDGTPIDLDLDLFRKSGFYFDRGDIGLYYSHAFPCEPKLWLPWLKLDSKPKPTGHILINRTTRYHNPKLSYKFLDQVPNVHFVGLAEEYTAFRKEQLCNVPHLRTETFLDLAKAVASCKLLIANQTVGFAIAEGFKVPRIVEVFPQAPNVAPHGPKGWQAFNQSGLEALVAEGIK